MCECIDAQSLRLVPQKQYPDKGFKKFIWGGKSAVMKETPALEPYDFNPDCFDAVILACPVWAGTFAPPIRTFLQQYVDRIATKRLGAVLCCSGGQGRALEKLSAAIPNAAFAQTMVLIDPLDKPDDANMARIESFGKGLTQQ